MDKKKNYKNLFKKKKKESKWILAALLNLLTLNGYMMLYLMLESNRLLNLLGGHWPRKGPWGPPFHTSRSPAVRKGPIQAKESVHKTPFWENLEILASTASIFTQILALKPPNWESFSSEAPLFRGNISSQAPHFGNPGCTSLPEKKIECPPPPG